jgi:hypothetical protein
MNIPGNRTNVNAEAPTEDETTRNQQDEETRFQQELIMRESLMYEQLEGAAVAAARATAAAASFKRGIPGGIFAASSSYEGAPHIPSRMTSASRTSYTATPPTITQPSTPASSRVWFSYCNRNAVRITEVETKGESFHGGNSFPVQ